MIKNLFLDRDGIVNEVVMRGNVVSSPRDIDEFRFKPDFLDFCDKIKSVDLNIFIVSNQPDIARNLMNKETLALMDLKIRQKLSIIEISYCIHDNEDNCHCRKPKPGLITDLIEKYGLDKKSSVIIGDSSKDILAGKNSGIATVYLKADYNSILTIEANWEINNLNEIFEQKGIFEFDYKSVN